MIFFAYNRSVVCVMCHESNPFIYVATIWIYRVNNFDCYMVYMYMVYDMDM